MVDKAAMVGGTVLRHAVEVLGEAAVEALDHAVGLRPERPGEAVGDGMPGTWAVEGMRARGLVVGFVFLVDGEAVGEFGAVVGEDAMARGGERLQNGAVQGGAGSARAL